MSSARKIHIIGVADDGLAGLSQTARQHLESAAIVIASDSIQQQIAHIPGEVVPGSSDLEELIQLCEKNADRDVVILATGDPLFYGTARFLCDRLGKDRFEVLPHVSSMQLAFARVKESWEEAYLTNLATQPLDRVAERIRSAEKVGIFTTDQSPPSRVAQFLLDRRLDYFHAYVCENLGSPDERVTRGELVEVAEQSFSPLNVMLLVRKPDVPDQPRGMAGQRLFGNPDEMFVSSKPKRHLATPAEVRTLALADLGVSKTGIVWDVGAGSGSVAIECAQLAEQGSVYAIEMDPQDSQLIAENAKRFGVDNVTPVAGVAPEAWHDLPDPDAVFIGGTGRQVLTIVEQAWQRLRSGGRIVANVASIENVSCLQELGTRLEPKDLQMRMIQISHATFQLETIRFESANPTFLFSAQKP